MQGNEEKCRKMQEMKRNEGCCRDIAEDMGAIADIAENAEITAYDEVMGKCWISEAI